MNSRAIKNKYDFLVIFDVEIDKRADDCDIDGGGGFIRIDANTGYGAIDRSVIVNLVREYAGRVRGGDKGYDVYREDTHRVKLEKTYKMMLRRHANWRTRQKAPLDRQLQKWMCRQFFDVRAFGTDLTVGESPGGRLAETFQFDSAKSVERVVAVSRETAVSGGGGDDVEENVHCSCALYKLECAATAILAEKTGFGDEDLKLVWQAIENIFNGDYITVIDGAAYKVKMTLRKRVVFKHKSALGNAPHRELLNRVSFARKNAGAAAGGYSGYEIKINRDGLPATVEVFEKTY